MTEIIRAEWCGKGLVDMLDNTFSVGDKVVKTFQSGRASSIEIRNITRIENGKLYLDGSHVAVNYPSRLLIVTKLFEDTHEW